MKRIGYILLFLVCLCVQFFIPKSAPTIVSVSTAGCTLQQPEHHSLVGIQGNPLTIAGEGGTQISAPTHFSSGAERVPCSKNRTRTAFLRRMIQHYQHVFLVFRGKERLETSPFATNPGSIYYVYCLRHILC